MSVKGHEAAVARYRRERLQVMRAEFAIAALQGAISHSGIGTERHAERAENLIKFVDAVIFELDKTP